MKLNDYQTHYVYLHRNPETKEVVYVGRGQRDRAWQVRVSGQRSEKHNQWMEDLLLEGYTPADWVDIGAKRLSKEEADRVETYLIEQYKPCFNRCKNKEYWESKKDPELQEIMETFREMGYSYKNIAYLTGVSAMKTWRYLNG